jgi:hypothetical protein
MKGPRRPGGERADRNEPSLATEAVLSILDSEKRAQAPLGCIDDALPG